MSRQSWTLPGIVCIPLSLYLIRWMSCRRDCVVYSSHCHKLEGRKVAVKVYEKSSLSPSKLRAVKREAAMMIYMTRKRWPSLMLCSHAS